MGIVEAILLTVITAATPLVLASLGELVTERSGVLNLGVEGMMVMGAVLAFAATQVTGSPYIGILAGIAGGGLFSLLFGFLTLTLVANQVATGLALTILGLGISGQIGEPYVGMSGIKLQPIVIPLLADIPFLGPLLFKQDLIFYLSIALIFGVNWFLFRSRAGLKLRAVGDSHASAHALGVHVIRTRYLAVMFGGAVPVLRAPSSRSSIRRNGWKTCPRDAAGSRWRSSSSPRGGPGGCWRAAISSARFRSASCTLRHWASASRRSSCRLFPISPRLSYSS
jgi:ABC-type uncharacterized transport system permease subunit